jgi:DNA-binding PucR family transcriptional regulator
MAFQQITGASRTLHNSSAFQDVARELAERTDEVAQQMASEILEQIEDFRDEIREDTFHSCRANIATIAVMLRDELEPMGASAPPEAVHLAREFVRAYRIGHFVLSRFLLEGLHERTTDQTDFAKATAFSTEWMFAYVDAVSADINVAYMQERERWVRSAEALRVDEVRAILDGRPVDEQEAGRRLRYELGRKHLAMLVWSDAEVVEDGAIGAFERVAHEVGQRLNGVDVLCVPQGRAVLAAWVGMRDEPDLSLLEGFRSAEAIACGAVVAVGEVGTAVEGFRRSNQEAQLARRVAALGKRSAGSVVHFKDVALTALMTNDLDEARRFVARELGQLAADTDASRRLAATLKVFLEEGASFVRAARRLGVHENTIAYRVRRAGEVLGHGVEERQLELRVALALADLLRKADR